MQRVFRTMICIGGIALAAWSAAAERSIDAHELVVSLGEPVTILRNGAMGMTYFPDQAISYIGDAKTFRLLVATGTDNASFLVEGEDLLHLKKAKKVLARGSRGSFDNGYAGISGAYKHSDGKLYAFYHAEDHEGIPSLGPGQPNGYYASVAVAESTDDGYTWRKLGRAIVSAKPKDFQAWPQHNARGAGLPGVTVDRSGKYLYLYYTDQSFASGSTQVCLARADLSAGPSIPAAFTKYFQGSFEEPGIGGKETPVLSAIHIDESHAMYAHPSYLPALDKYVVVFNVNRWKEPKNNLPATKSGVYLAHSTDGIRWSEPALLIPDYSYPLPGRSITWQATILWDDSQSKAGWLVYGHSPKWGHGQGGAIPHYMLGRRISIESVQ